MGHIAYLKDYRPGVTPFTIELRDTAQSFEHLIAKLLQLQADCEDDPEFVEETRAQIQAALEEARETLLRLWQSISAYEQAMAIGDSGVHR